MKQILLIGFLSLFVIPAFADGTPYVFTDGDKIAQVEKDSFPTAAAPGYVFVKRYDAAAGRDRYFEISEADFDLVKSGKAEVTSTGQLIKDSSSSSSSSSGYSSSPKTYDYSSVVTIEDRSGGTSSKSGGSSYSTGGYVPDVKVTVSTTGSVPIKHVSTTHVRTVDMHEKPNPNPITETKPIAKTQIETPTTVVTQPKSQNSSGKKSAAELGLELSDDFARIVDGGATDDELYPNIDFATKIPVEATIGTLGSVPTYSLPQPSKSDARKQERQDKKEQKEQEKNSKNTYVPDTVTPQQMEFSQNVFMESAGLPYGKSYGSPPDIVTVPSLPVIETIEIPPETDPDPVDVKSANTFGGSGIPYKPQGEQTGVPYMSAQSSVESTDWLTRNTVVDDVKVETPTDEIKPQYVEITRQSEDELFPRLDFGVDDAKEEKVMASTSQVNKINSLSQSIVSKMASASDDLSVWRNAEGKFNTSRLLSDSIAGVVGGVAGGLITGTVLKNNQIEKGFETVQCSVAGKTVANWGDTFQVSINTNIKSYKIGG